MANRQGKQATDTPARPAPRKPKIPDDVVDVIVTMYEQGATSAEIQRATGVPRGSQYYVREQRGIKPNRLGRADGRVNNNTLLDRLTESERECGELRAERDRLRATLDTLLERLGVTPAAAARVLGVSQRVMKGKP
jgi:hypothetical protein